MAKKSHTETLEDITNCKKKCILKSIVVRAVTDRDLEQIKCIGTYRDEVGKKEDRRLTWTEITEKWIKEGYAKKFAEVYDPKLHFNEIYKEIMRG